MATATSPKTLDDLLAMEALGIDCELIRGELRIRGALRVEGTLTTRPYPHSRVLIRLGHLLCAWLDRQPRPRGVVIGGEARVRIRRDPEMIVGIDLAYFASDLAVQTARGASFVDGPPVLAVEIESFPDTVGSMVNQVRSYLDSGIPLVWVVNPFSEGVTVHRPGLAPEFFNVTRELTAEPHLPGFRVPVAEIFVS